MKLLFDHNLSPRLISRLVDLHPDSQHVFLVGMDQYDDRKIWQYTIQNEFTIVTRDSDYNDLSLIYGFPPKVIWIRRGNCSRQEIEIILRSAHLVIQQFEKTISVGVLRANVYSLAWV